MNFAVVIYIWILFRIR